VFDKVCATSLWQYFYANNISYYMKNVYVLGFIAFLAVQCTQNPQEKPAEINTEAATFEVIAEELRPYALTTIDSVYSVRAQFTSKDTTTVVYHVQLNQGDQSYADSLVVSIPAGEVVQGELIFPACRVRNRPVPTFTAKITQIEN
jgi:hypothetical protein